jgi:hypothetical protein
MKGDLNLNEGDREASDGLSTYCGFYGWTFALAYAKSGDAAMISGFAAPAMCPDAIGQFSLAYLEQTERGHGRA